LKEGEVSVAVCSGNLVQFGFIGIIGESADFGFEDATSERGGSWHPPAVLASSTFASSLVDIPGKAIGLLAAGPDELLRNPTGLGVCLKYDGSRFSNISRALRFGSAGDLASWPCEDAALSGDLTMGPESSESFVCDTLDVSNNDSVF
jgi:hypothetical protein